MPAEHPSLSLRVSDAERGRAEALLSDAYAAGRLDEVELDRRLGLVMRAQTRRELNAVVVDLPRTPAPAAAFMAPAPARNPQATGVGGFAHLSGLVSWILGPLVLYALATPGTPARREAAKAFNFQFTAGIACILTGALTGPFLPGGLVGLIMTIGFVGWLVLSITGGARALSGQPWTNPVMRVIPWKVIDESGR
ncbi:MAG: DUF1707 and DUF4870 domain-containing protein [Propioniciclava sp.]|uniref:DUF1707 and DUF4870 domain-containing protein n=1 Tax=Propioniciclava sp. TaxID=2038686 RepID=UPI0039E5809E